MTVHETSKSTRYEESKMATVLDEFKDYCRRHSRIGIRETTLHSYAQRILVMIRTSGLPYDKLDADTLARVVLVRAKRCKPSTFNSEIAVLRHWVGFHGLDVEDKEIRKELKFKRVIPNTKHSDSDVLMPEDVETLINHLRTSSWKALVACLWDLGCRIGELVGLDYADVTRDQFGFVLHIRHSKTVARKLRLITPIGLKYFTPFYVGHDKRGALFKSYRLSRISTATIRSILRKKKVGGHIQKPCYPTWFRKSASTYWKKTALLPDAAIRKRLGHTADSKIFESWYFQWGDQSQQNAELAALGVYQEVDVQPKPKRCWRCGIAIPNSEAHCLNCTAPASGKTLLEDVRAQEEFEELKERVQRLEGMEELLRDFLKRFAGITVKVTYPPKPDSVS